MLPPALVLQTQCLLPTVLSRCSSPSPVLPVPHTSAPHQFFTSPPSVPHQSFQCPSPFLPVPHTGEGPGTTPAKHRAPVCFPQAPWSCTVSCRLLILLSPSHPSGKGQGPPALHPPPLGSSPHPPQLCPGSFQLLLLAWQPQVLPRLMWGSCSTVSPAPSLLSAQGAQQQMPFHTFGAFPRGQLPWRLVVSLWGLCSPALPGFVRA